MTTEEMKDRTKRFALRIVALVAALPASLVARELGRQLLKAGTAVGANYRAACRARSRADFIAKMGIVEEESDESRFWLEILRAADLVGEGDFIDLNGEAGEWLAIVVSSINTARTNRGARSRG